MKQQQSIFKITKQIFSFPLHVTEQKFTDHRNMSLKTPNYGGWYAKSDRQKLIPVLLAEGVSEYKFVLVTYGNTQGNLHTVFKIFQLYEHVNSGAAGLHVFYKYMPLFIINTLQCHILNVRVELEYITESYDCE